MSQGFRRYHSLDALRASMMLLGLVLHSAVNYAVAPLGEAWPYKDQSTSTLFDMAVFFIHLFRMPVFFVVAGFFAALLMAREGAAGFLRNRVMRVLVPLAVCWPFVYPLIAAGFIYANTNALGRVDMSPFTSGAFLATASLAHLWFLWDLMIFYAAAVLVARLAARLSTQAVARIESGFARIATSLGGALVMALITTLTLLPMEVAGLETSVSLLPPLRVLAAYAVFFTFGWLLYRRRDVIDDFARRWKVAMALGVLSTIGYLAITVGRVIPSPVGTHVAGCAVAGVAIWMLIIGIVGAFVSHLGQPRPIVRYASDASYWIYIVHLPLAIGIPGLMAAWTAPAFVKFSITLLGTFTVTALSYHFLVRATAIGALLNGRRYPRALPAVERERAPQVAAV